MQVIAVTSIDSNRSKLADAGAARGRAAGVRRRGLLHAIGLGMTTALALVTGPGLGRAHATEVGIQRSVGVGLVAGSSPGLTAKLWTRPTNAFDFGVGFGLGSFACSERFNPCGRRTSFNADYLWQSGHGARDLLSLHVGLGARFWFWDYGAGASDFQVAGRLPLGLDLYAFDWMEVYAEFTPSVAFDPSVFFLEGALGLRIYL
jgi:hypothetical protein